MKKVLFATTALVASAGIASADGHVGVAISGGAEMGVIGGDRHGETQFLQSVDVRFAMTGETSGGLTFGATIDLDDLADMAINGDDPVDVSGGEFADFTVFISGNFGTLTMGDTDGAFDWALQEVAVGAGTIDDSHTFHAGYNGNSGLDGDLDGQIVRYDYSFGDFAFAASVEMDDAGVLDPTFGIGLKYGASLGAVDLGLGLGYQSSDLTDIVGVSVDASFAGGFRAVVNYSDGDGYEHMAIGGSYSMDAITVSANYGVYSFDAAGVADSEGFGLAANYDLGGGAVVQFGYGSGKEDNGLGLNTQGASVESYSLGISMSF